MLISSRTPEGKRNHCPICNADVCIEPSRPPGDAPCPRCGSLLWFSRTPSGEECYDYHIVAPFREKISRIVCERLGITNEQISNPATSFLNDIGADSLDIVELVMELEEEFGITIPDDEAEKIKTVGDAIGFLFQHGM